MDIWFSADTHYWHTNIIKFCNRPFSSSMEMNEKLIENHNSVVKPNDVYFHLGDFAISNAANANSILSRLNGQKILIFGNHDFSIKNKLVGFREILGAQSLQLNKQWFYLNHYAMRSWDKQHFGSINLFGHSHGKLGDAGLKQMDVGVDTNNYMPYNITEIIEKFKDFKHD